MNVVRSLTPETPDNPIKPEDYIATFAINR